MGVNGRRAGVGGAGLWVGLVGLLSGAASATEARWETISTAPILIQTRAWGDGSIREVRAEAVLDVEVEHVEGAVLDSEGYVRFMPYVKEAKVLKRRGARGGRLVYTRLELPFVRSRDYVVEVNVVRTSRSDGVFENRWQAAPGVLPDRPHVIRLNTNQGSWTVTPLGNGKSRAVYTCVVDPGGWVPGFAQDMANRTGVADLFRAVQAEAQRRRAEQPKRAAGPPAGLKVAQDGTALEEDSGVGGSGDAGK